MKAFYGQEARELYKDNPKEFDKMYRYYNMILQTRIKTFEKHGRSASSSAQKLREALYDIKQAKNSIERTSAFSRASFVLTSARGSYTASLQLDKKIIIALNQQFGVYNEEGKLIKPFLKMSELDEFGMMMDAVKDMSLDKVFSSSQLARVVREVMNDNNESLNWRTMLSEKLGGLGK